MKRKHLFYLGYLLAVLMILSAQSWGFTREYMDKHALETVRPIEMRASLIPDTFHVKCKYAETEFPQGGWCPEGWYLTKSGGFLKCFTCTEGVPYAPPGGPPRCCQCPKGTVPGVVGGVVSCAYCPEGYKLLKVKEDESFKYPLVATDTYCLRCPPGMYKLIINAKCPRGVCARCKWGGYYLVEHEDGTIECRR